MTTINTMTGKVAALRTLADRVPRGHERVVREMAQKECEADLRAHDALIVRGNTLLAASGVAVSLLLGLSKESAVNTSTERTLLVLALAAAAVAAVLVLLSMHLFRAETQMDNETLLGVEVPVGTAEAWQRDHELLVALQYFEIRMNLAGRHRRRARLLRYAQRTFGGFLALVSALGIAIPL